MNDQLGQSTLESDLHYCAVHPQRDTELRCNRCDRYMCIDCAVRTPVGYTCRQCVRGHEDKFYEGSAVDYGLVAAICAIGGALTPFAMMMIGGFLIIGFIVAPAIGGTAAQFALQLTKRRRGRYSGYVAAGGVLVGGLVSAFLLGALNMFTLLFLALATSAAYARFKVTI